MSENRRGGDLERAFQVMKVAVAKPYVFGPYEDFVTCRRVEQELSEYKGLTWILQHCCHDWGVHPISFRLVL
jgi:hypothetical protein